MKIDRKLNLVFEVGGKWIHSVPISNGVFEQYYLVMAKTFARMHRERLGLSAAPRVVKLMLRQVATEDGVWDTSDGVQNGLMAEIIRLTNVVYVSEDGTGWKSQPFYTAKQGDLFTEDEISEVENTLVFFTLVSAMHRKEDVPAVMASMTAFWGGQLLSLNFTEYVASLPTLTPKEDTTPTVTTSSVPS